MCYFGLYRDGQAGFDGASVLSVINLMVTVKQKITSEVNKNLRMIFGMPKEAQPQNIIVVN